MACLNGHVTECVTVDPARKPESGFSPAISMVKGKLHLSNGENITWQVRKAGVLLNDFDFHGQMFVESFM